MKLFIHSITPHLSSPETFPGYTVIASTLPPEHESPGTIEIPDAMVATPPPPIPSGRFHVLHALDLNPYRCCEGGAGTYKASHHAGKYVCSECGYHWLRDKNEILIPLS